MSKSIKDIALELLKKYEYAKEYVILEYSGDINQSLISLRDEVCRYKEAIENLDN